MSQASATLPRTRAARHLAGASTPAWRLLLGMTLRMQARYLLTLPSNQAWRVLRRKYDAFTTDRAYDERPSSWLGPLGWWADRRVLNYPVHVALRQRLAIVSATLASEIERSAENGDAPVRLLTAPCGLCRDVIDAVEALRLRDPAAAALVELHALDLDPRGDVIPEARRRLERAGISASFYREDLLKPAALRAYLRRGACFQIVSCIGLAAWLDLQDVGRLAWFLHESVMAPGGLLLMDNFARHAHSDAGADLEIAIRYHPSEAFMQTLRDAGFTIEAAETTANGVVTVVSARA